MKPKPTKPTTPLGVLAAYSKYKAQSPAPTGPTASIPELDLIRRLIRQTHRAVRRGTIDYLAGMRVIARLTESLAVLLRISQTLNPTTDVPVLDRQDMDRILAIFDSESPQQEREEAEAPSPTYNLQRT